MRTTTLPHPPIYARPAPKPSALLQTLLTLLIGFSLFTVFLSIAVLGFNLAYANKSLPRRFCRRRRFVWVNACRGRRAFAGTDEIPQDGKIVFQEGANVWIARPEELGFILDAPTSVQAAYLVGRSGSLLSRAAAQFNAWSEGKNLSPLFVLDERIAQNYLQKHRCAGRRADR